MTYTPGFVMNVDEEIQQAFQQIINNHGLNCTIKSVSYNEEDDHFCDHEILDYNRETTIRITNTNDEFLCNGWYNIIVDNNNLCIKNYYVSGTMCGFGETEHKGIFNEFHDTMVNIRKKYNAKDYIPIDFETYE